LFDLVGEFVEELCSGQMDVALLGCPAASGNIVVNCNPGLEGGALLKSVAEGVPFAADWIRLGHERFRVCRIMQRLELGGWFARLDQDDPRGRGSVRDGIANVGDRPGRPDRHAGEGFVVGV